MNEVFECKDAMILYVEDEHIEREQTAQFLKRNFNTVMVAPNGKDALEIYKNNYFDVVITDINMPIMDGVEMSQKIREISPEQAIIVVSAFDFSDNLHSFLKKDVEFFIKKPFDLKNLLVAIKEVCAKIKEREALAKEDLSKDEIIDLLKKRVHELERKIEILEDKINH
ncbi:MAG: hypothetical protein QG567_1572 [Campylobacterota bacterium]|nr:hypothetical protein [Campylobacterota bacterium]